jgi:transposase
MPGMAQRFIACDREQSFLMPPDVREWLPANHLAWFVIDAVDEMNLDAFYAAYRFDGRSRPPYDPAMMVALLLYAYARGVPSSRQIERACVEDVAFRVIAAQQRPDHATIARFVQTHQDAVAGLFCEVLTLCARNGLAQVGVIAVDGTKVAASASRDANLDYEQVARELVEQAIATDRAEDERFGEARGDELPPEFSTSAGRRGWLREANKRLEAERSADPEPVSRDRPKRLKQAKRRLDEELFTEVRANRAYEAWRARGIAADGSRRMAPGMTKPYSPPPTPEGKVNVTDPDSKVVKGLRNWLQGYNAQAVTNEQHIVLAAEIETVGADFSHLEPMLDAAQHELTAAGVQETPGVLLADAGYWHSEQMARVVDRGIVPLIPPDTSRKRTTRRNWEGGHYEFMRRVLSTEHGAALYRKRQPMIESVFAQVKFNRGLDRFRRRGRGAVRTEWRLITATHNLLKLHRHTLAAA